MKLEEILPTANVIPAVNQVCAIYVPNRILIADPVCLISWSFILTIRSFASWNI